ncbi:uncharacterized protein LOC126818260 [Patella vulgata]|uniref:uncharacterized protein LOC126818260 n=1 Tax=Patella vulgata TaxID=6465 RepID=UPI0024A9F342|nr:uncharacterized protein LOC126818260 [Patella vulgata]
MEVYEYIHCIYVLIYLLQTTNPVLGKECYNFDCYYTSNCKGDHDNKTGICTGTCSEGWYGPTCQMENVALGKSVEQNIPRTGEWKTGYVVDGNISTSVCVAEGGLDPLQVDVDLNQVYLVKNVTIYYSPNDKNTIYGFSVYTAFTHDREEGNSTLCYQHGSGEDVPDIINIECSSSGSFVIIMNSRLNPPYPESYSKEPGLELCEVQVFVCSNGTFGVQCEYTCHCNGGKRCDDRTGVCPPNVERKCDFGWIGDKCDRNCLYDNTYGNNCDKACSDRHCLNQSPCNPSNGSCDDGCEDGYIGIDCILMQPKVEVQNCVSGTYGTKCDLLCSGRHCLHQSSCNPSNGSCDDGCEDGYTGIDCTYTQPQAGKQLQVDDTGLTHLHVGIIGFVCGLVVCILCVGIIYACCRSRSKERPLVVDYKRKQSGPIYDDINGDFRHPQIAAISNIGYDDVIDGNQTTTLPRIHTANRPLPEIVIDDTKGFDTCSSNGSDCSQCRGDRGRHKAHKRPAINLSKSQNENHYMDIPASSPTDKYSKGSLYDTIAELREGRNGSYELDNSVPDNTNQSGKNNHYIRMDSSSMEGSSEKRTKAVPYNNLIEDRYGLQEPDNMVPVNTHPSEEDNKYTRMDSTSPGTSTERSVKGAMYNNIKTVEINPEDRYGLREPENTVPVNTHLSEKDNQYIRMDSTSPRASTKMSARGAQYNNIDTVGINLEDRYGLQEPDSPVHADAHQLGKEVPYIRMDSPSRETSPAKGAQGGPYHNITGAVPINGADRYGLQIPGSAIPADTHQNVNDNHYTPMDSTDKKSPEKSAINGPYNNITDQVRINPEDRYGLQEPDNLVHVEIHQPADTHQRGDTSNPLSLDTKHHSTDNNSTKIAGIDLNDNIARRDDFVDHGYLTSQILIPPDSDESKS